MLYNAWRHVLPSLRRRRNLSQRTAASRANVATITWRRWEAGRISPKPESLESIARAVGYTPRKVAFEYSRLLFRFYCHQMGYEFPALHQIAGRRIAGRRIADTGEDADARSMTKSESDGPVSATPTTAGDDPATI